MGLALLFPGQGAQHADMLPWLEREAGARPLLRRLSDALGRDWRSRLDDVEWRTSNAVAQPLLVGIELAAWACLEAVLPVPVAVAGYSVGELAAFGAAGVIDPFAALTLSQRRAEAMDRSAADQTTGLLAVRDLPLPALMAWCERHGLSLSIRLGADRAIVGGSTDALRSAAGDPAVSGDRLTPIAVRIASHTPWMRDAVAPFARHLASIELRSPRCPIVCNLTGAATRRPAELAHGLAHQIAQPVLWDLCLETLVERGVTCVLEVGPGTTLSAMWRVTAPEIPVRSVDEFRSAGAAAAWALKAVEAGRR